MIKAYLDTKVSGIDLQRNCSDGMFLLFLDHSPQPLLAVSKTGKFDIWPN